MSFSPSKADIEVGMNVYATSSSPAGGKMRVANGDFLVIEIVDTSVIRTQREERHLPLYRVEKRGMDTFHAAELLSKELNSRVSFGGLKDKSASTVQYMSPTSVRSESPPVVEKGPLKAIRVGYIERPLSRSMIAGNAFVILLREPAENAEGSIEETFDFCRTRRLPNFFGLQRFGVRSRVTHKVGRAVVKGNYEEAIGELIWTARTGDSDEIREARRLASIGEYEKALVSLAPGQDVERKVLRHLAGKPQDFLGAIRAISIGVRRLLVHAYQSYIFNRTLSEAIGRGLDVSSAKAGDNWALVGEDGLTVGRPHGSKEEPPQKSVPLIQLVGYAHRNYGSRFDAIMEEILHEEEIDPRRFYVKEAQELSMEGGFRCAPLLAKELRYRRRESGIELGFALAKGEYATTLMREIVKPADPVSAGF